MIIIDYRWLLLISIDYHWLLLIIIDFNWLSLIIIDHHWLSLIIIDYHWLSLIYIEYHWLSLIILIILENLKKMNDWGTDNFKSIDASASKKRTYIGAPYMKKCTHINLFPNKLNMLTDIQINPFQNKILGNYIPKCCRILFKGGYRILKWMHLVVRLVRGSGQCGTKRQSVVICRSS